MTEKKHEKWSQLVTQSSHALDLEPGVFTWDDPQRIAESLKQAAEESECKKGSAYQAAMSMLNFYINRAGSNLAPQQRLVLEQAKDALRDLFHRTKMQKPD